MHESGALNWREMVERHHSLLIDDLSSRLDSDLREAVERARREAIASQSELLNQDLRRLRQAHGEEHILQVLSESCAPYAEHRVVLLFENNQARAVGSDAAIAFDIAAAAAVVTAIESRDPVIALATPTELPAVLLRMLGVGEDEKPGRNAYLFPLNARHSVVAMLIASGPTSVAAATIELLCEAASMRLETLIPVGTHPESSAFVQLPKTTGSTERLSWDALSPEDQKLHLQAQRTARVRVAEMRLYNERELRAGLASGDIYGALQKAVDSARRQFLQTYLAKSPTMVDYLHLEILRALAHDDDRLLGPNYPGPMV